MLQLSKMSKSQKSTVRVVPVDELNTETFAKSVNLISYTSSSYKATSPIRLRPTFTTYFTLIISNGFISKYSHIGVRASIYKFGGDKIQSIVPSNIKIF